MFNNAEIAELRGLYASALFDTCVPLAYGATAGSYGVGQPTYTAGDPVPCLFLPGRDKEESAGGQNLRIDGRVLLPRDFAFDNLARLRITHLHGDALTTPQTYEIVAGPVLDHTGVTVKVRLVTDGS